MNGGYKNSLKLDKQAKYNYANSVDDNGLD